jgi:hypothetical protein
MAAKTGQNSSFKKQILKDGGWIRKPAVTTMTAHDIVKRPHGSRANSCPACAHGQRQHGGLGL